MLSVNEGPIGVGALFISTLAIRRLPTPNFPPQTHIDMLALSIGILLDRPILTQADTF